MDYQLSKLCIVQQIWIIILFKTLQKENISIVEEGWGALSLGPFISMLLHVFSQMKSINKSYID